MHSPNLGEKQFFSGMHVILQLDKKSICTEVKFFFQPKISLFGAE